NLLYQLFWIAAYAAIGFINVTWLFVAIVLPHLGAVVGSGIRVYIEHAGTDAKLGREARSFSSRFWTVLFFATNLHLDGGQQGMHSLGMVGHEGLHEWLKKQGFFECNASSSPLHEYRR